MFRLKNNTLKIKTLIVTIFATLSLGASMMPVPASAAIQANCPDGFQFNIPNNVNVSEFIQQKCANHQTGSSTDDTTEGTSASNNLDQDCDDKSGEVTAENCNIVKWLVILINVMSGLVGIIIVISIIVAGIQWTTAGNNPQQVAAAKSRIFNALLAAFVFIFMYSFLQWIVPGGLF